MNALGSGLKNQQFDLASLPKFEKDFYREAPEVTARSEEEIAKFRRDNQITVFGRDVPRPVQNFSEAGYPDYVMSEIKKVGFEKPTPIQCQGWPMALSGRDLVGVSQTGKKRPSEFWRGC